LFPDYQNTSKEIGASLIDVVMTSPVLIQCILLSCIKNPVTLHPFEKTMRVTPSLPR
jgi:hypothetical protein